MTCRFNTPLADVLRPLQGFLTAHNSSDTGHTGRSRAQHGSLQGSRGQAACQGKKGYPIKGDFGNSTLLSPELCCRLLGERIACPLRYVNCHNSTCAV